MRCHGVTGLRDSGIQQRRGLSRCHAVTTLSPHVRVCVREEGAGECMKTLLGKSRDTRDSVTSQYWRGFWCHTSVRARVTA